MRRKRTRKRKRKKNQFNTRARGNTHSRFALRPRCARGTRTPRRRGRRPALAQGHLSYAQSRSWTPAPSAGQKAGGAQAAVADIVEGGLVGVGAGLGGAGGIEVMLCGHRRFLSSPLRLKQGETGAVRPPSLHPPSPPRLWRISLPCRSGRGTMITPTGC